ncbi:MAG: S24 family peptidase [Hellea sp.]
MDISDGKSQRDYIQQAVQERADIDYKTLSEVIGKNPTYVQQFITKGSPRALREADMRILMCFIDGESSSTDVVQVPLYEFKAGMGGGGVILTEMPDSFMPVSEAYIKDMRLGSADLIAIECEGDSMSPTLISGDQIMINRKDRNPARGGIFTIFDSDTLVVKRIEKIPNSDPVMLKLISDNPHHNSYDVIADDTNIIGRVVWFARRI